MLQRVRGAGWPVSEPVPALALQVWATTGLPEEVASQLAHVDPTILSTLLAVPATPQ